MTRFQDTLVRQSSVLTHQPSHNVSNQVEKGRPQVHRTNSVSPSRFDVRTRSAHVFKFWDVSGATSGGEDETLSEAMMLVVNKNNNALVDPPQNRNKKLTTKTMLLLLMVVSL